MSIRPIYLKTLEKGVLLQKVEEAKRHITNCNLCPHKCGVNRMEEVGVCKASNRAVVSSYGPHIGEGACWAERFWHSVFWLLQYELCLLSKLRNKCAW